MATKKNDTTFAAFEHSINERAKCTPNGFINLKVAFCAIVCDFEEVNAIFTDVKMPLRDFANVFFDAKSAEIISHDVSPSLDVKVLLNHFKDIEKDLITELDIFLAVMTTICRRPNSNAFSLLNENVCTPKHLLEQTELMLNNSSPKTTIVPANPANNIHIAEPIGLTSIINRIDTLKNSQIGLLIEINSPTPHGKTELINYLAQRYASQENNVFLSCNNQIDSTPKIKSSIINKTIIVDDIDQKKDVLHLVKKDVFKKGTTIICSTTKLLDTTRLEKCRPENHIIINLDIYTEEMVVEIIDNRVDFGIGRDVFDIASKSGFTNLGELLQIAVLSNTIKLKDPSLSTKERITSAIFNLYGVEEKSISNIVDVFKTLENKIKTQIFGQDFAIEKICNSIRTNLMGFKTNDARPNGIFALVGASGVGKTQTARIIAQDLGFNCLVLNMGEYHSSSHINKLIGAAAGYVGYDKGNGILYDAIQKNPKTIIILDEIEKADPKIADLFLSCFDSGAITTSSGLEVSFSESIFFLTSNSGITHGAAPIGINKSNTIDTTLFNLDDFKSDFRSEFTNRFTDIIEFSHLNKESLLSITNYSISKILKNASSKLGCQFSLSHHVATTILDKCDTKECSARPIERMVESTIGGAISKYIVDNGVLNNTISITVVDGEITVS